MKSSSLRVYAVLSRWPFPRSYRGKVLGVALLGAVVPLASLALAAGRGDVAPTFVRWLGWTAAAAAAVAALAAWLLDRLHDPVRLTAESLRAYLRQYRKPQLPTAFGDEVGGLMADAQHAIDRLDEVVIQLATYDRLTGLPNRALFLDQVKTALAQSRRSGRRVAVLIADVEGFRTVSLTFGHAAGDRLLTAVAQRLGAAVREGDVVARLDGGEFAILSASVESAEDVDAQARRVLEALSRPFLLGTQEVSVRPSIGITVFPDDAGSVEQLLNNAGAAQRAVHDAGGTGYRFYAAELNARLHARVALEADLRHALGRGQLLLHFQPKIDVATGRVCGFEALLRWQHPERGSVSPADFIPVAEETGLIVPIGEWVLRTACRQVRAWVDAGLPALPVAVNLSARQFRQEGLVELVRDALAEARVDARLLELEVTESLLMEDTARTVCTLERLRGQGITIALDDFGTGYSSLSYLKRFPVDTIKMDKSFVRDVASDAQSGAIATAIVTLAHSLGMDVVAEGVETRDQLESLAARGCDTVQGFLFSRPVPAGEIAELVRRFAGEVVAPAAAPLRMVSAF